MSEMNRAIEQHYARGNLSDIILGALKNTGKQHDALAHTDMAPLDEFHIRGREATKELAELAGIKPEHSVLDVGCGIGGPSRFLASEVGCRVTGIDLTPEYCEVASMLADRTGLSGMVEYRQGDALNLPFEDCRFDVVWTQHASMNIPDKKKLFSEMYRVLRAGGTLAVYDVTQGEGGENYFPVPWAPDSSISFLMTPDEMRKTLESVGFHVQAWHDVTEAAREWFQGMVLRMKQQGPPPLGLHVLIGPGMKTMFGNMGKNLQEHRLRVVQAALTRP